jgi:signal transduction histidine kinase
VAILRDVTEHRDMHDLLEGMRSRLLNLQENERANIARVLHDTIGQNISILDFNLTTIEELLDETSRERIAEVIAGMGRVIRETGDKLRDTARGLHPREVHELGLAVGVSSFIKRFQRMTKLQVSTAIQVEGLEVDESIAINLYRIIREVFTNIIKHSKCQSVTFQMTGTDDRLVVRIRDDGIGFSPEEVAKRGIERQGMGLFIIRERARAVRGRLKIHSGPSQGTEVEVEVPC